ncbi:hypothetical protein [Luteolibacter marinus]|uniref:hypothetical protein n=1 Tax=Luteolibacter marinus TaxID=2776705 RepID=UPI001866D47F|nr:hypothetical protein [Luteolibacter marinus]
MKSLLILVGAIPALVPVLFAETVNRTGIAGTPGTSGSSPGQSGSNGGNGEGLTDSVVSTTDADKSLTLVAGSGGTGGGGGANANGTGGSGGRGGHGGAANGTGEITLDAPSQILSLTIRGGNSGQGANGASKNGGGGDAGTPGDATAHGTLTAGASTTLQRATFNVNAGASNAAGAGHVDTQAQTGGTGGLGKTGGEARASLVMHGGVTTTTQQVNITSLAGANGPHGSGSGLGISLLNDPSHPVGSEVDFDISTPADNASVSASVISGGGGGIGRPASVSGGPMPSRGVLRASRIEASGSNASITAGMDVRGGTCVSYAPPSLGITYAIPGDFPSVARGASPLVEPLDLVAGPGGSIGGSVTLSSGAGGAVFGGSLLRPGDGGKIEVTSPVLRAVSGGGSIGLTLSGNAGAGGSGTSRNGTGGHVSLFNGLSADTAAGQVSLTQTATGGQFGGRGLSHLEIDGTTSGILTVNATASGGQVSDGSSPGSSLGSGDATAIVRGIGSHTTANATATGNTASSVSFGAYANALGDATGPSNVSTVALARAGKGINHGSSTATSVARVTSAGTIASARSTTNGNFGKHDATAVSAGHASLPVSWVASTYAADRISRGISDVSNAALAGANVPNTSFANFATRNASFDDQNAGQKQQAVTTPFGSNPVPAAFFDNLTDERHLISCRFVQPAGTYDFPNGATTTHTHGGVFKLRAGASGGQLVMSGVGFTSSGDGFDDGVFRFLKDGVAVQEIPFANPAEAAAVFANQSTVLADLSQANDGTVFSWEVQFTVSASTQGFSGDFLLSATEDSGLATAPPAPPVQPVIDQLTVSIDLSDAFAPAGSFDGSIGGAAPFSQVGIEASADLGEDDPWTVIRTVTADSTGRAMFGDLRHPAQPDAPKMFLRARTE